MKNKTKVIIIMLIIIAIAVLAIIVESILNPKIRGIVVRPHERSIMLMDLKDQGLYSIGIPDEINTKLKQGQEILVYLDYETIIDQSNPAIISSNGVKKIKVLKEQSNKKIPEEILKRIYINSDNVDISIDNISQTELTLTLTDNNTYKDEYKLSTPHLTKKTERNDYIRRKIAIVNPTNISDNIVKVTYNWEEAFGKLEDGEYNLQTSIARFLINIKINIDTSSGTIKYTVDNQFFPYWIQ